MSKTACLMIGSMIGLAACAMGGSTQQQQQVVDATHSDGTNVSHDAASVTDDAKVFHDAPFHPLDAFVPKDAPLGAEGDVCTDNTNCGPTLCCFVAFCVQGTPVGTTLCFPAN
ncbi:MAG: hypothetical protein ABI591_31620 [Kofleriaceae bacterium]